MAKFHSWGNLQNKSLNYQCTFWMCAGHCKSIQTLCYLQRTSYYASYWLWEGFSESCCSNVWSKTLPLLYSMLWSMAWHDFLSAECYMYLEHRLDITWHGSGGGFCAWIPIPGCFVSVSEHPQVQDDGREAGHAFQRTCSWLIGLKEI